MYPPPQSLTNNTPQGNIGQPKLIINDELSQQQCELNYNYPILQQVQQPTNQLNYKPYQQPYQLPLLKQQQAIYSNPHQVVPNIEQLNNENNEIYGQYQDQNKSFGICVTSIWAILSLLDYLFVLYFRFDQIPYQLGILCIILMFLIPFIVVKINVNKSTHFSRQAQVLVQDFTTQWVEFIYTIYYFNFIKLEQMVTAFFYILNTQNKPEAKELIKLTSVVLIINLILYCYEVIRYIDFFGFSFMFNILACFFFAPYYLTCQLIH